MENTIHIRKSTNHSLQPMWKQMENTKTKIHTPHSRHLLLLHGHTPNSTKPTEDGCITTKQEIELLVICYHCGKVTPKKEAYYIQEWDAYYCEKHYKDLINNKSVRKPNWRKRGI